MELQFVLLNLNITLTATHIIIVSRCRTRNEKGRARYRAESEAQKEECLRRNIWLINASQSSCFARPTWAKLTTATLQHAIWTLAHLKANQCAIF